MSVVEDIQRPDLGTVVELYDVDCSAIFGEVLRFAPAPLIADRNDPLPQPITWRGLVYVPRACESSGWQWDGQGPLPQPKLTIGNTDRSISALCIAYSDLQGAIVTRRRVPMKYLDGMPDADPDVEFDPDIYAIDQKTLQNKMVVEFTLGVAIELVGRLIPARQVLQGYCSFRYRHWNGSAFVYRQGSAACPTPAAFISMRSAIRSRALRWSVRLPRPSFRRSYQCGLKTSNGFLHQRNGEKRHDRHLTVVRR